MRGQTAQGGEPGAEEWEEGKLETHGTWLVARSLAVGTPQKDPCACRLLLVCTQTLLLLVKGSDLPSGKSELAVG